MGALILGFVLLGSGTAVGVAIGWWVRNGQLCLWENNLQKDDKEDNRRARRAIGRLRSLASQVATEVGEHTSRVQEINDEMSDGGAGDPDRVVEAMAKLIDANKHMQQKLADAEERLQEQATELASRIAEALTDVLTKLANRRAFDEEMDRRCAEFQRHGRPVSVVMLDVDRFKDFNDTHGHQAGDDVLRGVARVLRRTLRDMDIPCRYGGEEFAAILPGTVVRDAGIVVERARRLIEKEPFYFKREKLHVAVSGGAAELLPGETVEALIQRADAGLYASKAAGRNCCHLHDGRTCYRLDSQDPRPSGSLEEKLPPAQTSSCASAPDGTTLVDSSGEAMIAGST